MFGTNYIISTLQSNIFGAPYERSQIVVSPSLEMNLYLFPFNSGALLPIFGFLINVSKSTYS